jgi:monothiol glutaredoxin
MSETRSDVQSRIQGLIDANKVFLFMKGTPTFPQCGFSATVVSILDHVGVDYGSANVLEDAELRQGVKDFSDWPTIPQLYVGGEFVGGCDILKEMYTSGELTALFEEKGVTLEA